MNVSKVPSIEYNELEFQTIALSSLILSSLWKQTTIYIKTIPVFNSLKNFD